MEQSVYWDAKCQWQKEKAAEKNKHTDFWTRTKDT